MSRSLHFISNTIPGYGTHDGRYYSGFGSAVGISPNSRISPISSCGNWTITSNVKFLSLRCGLRCTCFVCFASSSNYRRSSNFSRQNKHGFSRNRNRHREEINGYEDLEETEALTSKFGSLLSITGNQKLQATATPGPREKEIVELFQKVQAKLRERAERKKEKKVEDSQGKSKGSETVDSLLKLLRKHSIQQGKKDTSSPSNRDFIPNQLEQVDPSAEQSCTGISDTSSTLKHEMQESPRPHLSRPKSNFRRRYVVPEIKFEPVYSGDSVNSVTHNTMARSTKGITLEPETDHDHEIKIESTVETIVSQGNVLDEKSEDETSKIAGSKHDDVADEDNLVEANNVSAMKLTELRALAKSLGTKGFSKLRKNELIELLSGSSIHCLMS